MPAEWSPEALADLEDICAYIARDNPKAAEAWIEKLISKAEKASAHARAGRVVPEIEDPDIREVFLKSYRIIYRVEPERVVVLTVLEGHRRLRANRQR
ncbi:type II toxin-antitoxin system RelE/ParE family toxin [Sorangium sp. So ce1182]|uniref:type II toxin-antitoxin system RelE/ParE family toxin n=1 Tax=Sorangium sp. So ce1182 TaxID=3133334 RepID=UPI003F6171FA